MVILNIWEIGLEWGGGGGGDYSKILWKWFRNMPMVGDEIGIRKVLREFRYA